MTTRLSFSEGGWIFVDGGAHVHQGADGEQCDLAGVAADLVEEESDGVGVSGLGEAVVLGVAALRESALGGRGNTSSYRDFRPTSFGKEAVEELGAGLGVTEGGSDAEDLEFGAAEGQCDGEGIVDVVADVGIDDYFFGDGFLRNRRGWRGLH